MKRMISVVIMLVGLLSFVAVVNAGGGSSDYVGRKTFSIEGEFVEYVSFPFIVPSGCGDNIKTFEYIPNFGWGGSAYWEELAPGSVTPSWGGIFKFNVDGSYCNREFSIEGPVNNFRVYEMWSGMEQDPEDLGVLTPGEGLAHNHFGLSRNDRKFSYVIVYPRYGQKCTLDALIKFSQDEVGIRPSSSEVVGAIIANERGFLTRKIDLDLASKVMVYEELVVLIFKEKREHRRRNSY